MSEYEVLGAWYLLGVGIVTKVDGEIAKASGRPLVVLQDIVSGYVFKTFAGEIDIQRRILGGEHKYMTSI